MDFKQIMYLQFYVAHAYMKKHNLTPGQFRELDEKTNLLHYIATCYEPFHLTGIQGIMQNVEDYVGI